MDARSDKNIRIGRLSELVERSNKFDFFIQTHFRIETTNDQ